MPQTLHVYKKEKMEIDLDEFFSSFLQMMIKATE